MSEVPTETKLTLDQLDSLLELLQKKQQSNLQLARVVYQLSQLINYDQLNQLLEAKGYKEAIKRSQWNNYIRVYQYWVIEGKFELEQLKHLGITKLFIIAVNQLPLEEAPVWLERARSLSSRKLLEEVKEAVRKTPLKEPFKTLRLPESVHNAFEHSLLRLRSVTGEATLSPIAYVEWMAEFISNAPADMIKELWMALHGAPEMEEKIV